MSLLTQRSPSWAPRCAWCLVCVIACAWHSVPAITRANDPGCSQFRGNSGQGDLGAVSLPKQWGTESGIAWRAAISGLGYSSPVHDDATIWLTTASRDGRQLQVLSVSAATGESSPPVTVFTPDHVEEIHHTNSYASPSPVLQGDRLFVHFGTYGTACIKTTTGEVVWKNNDFPVSHEGGPGSSPVLYEDLLILTLDGADSQRLVALDCATGQARWTRHRSAPFPQSGTEKRAFSTPLLIEHSGQAMLVSSGAQQCHAYHPGTGEELWHVRYTGFSTVPRPVYDGRHCYICTGFFNPELWAIDPSGSGDVSETHIRWRFKGEVPETPSPLVIGDSVYVLSNKGVLTILNSTTGKRQGVLRLGGNYSASPIHAGGLAYFCNEEGMTKVVQPQLAKPRILHTNRLEERIMASPVAIGSDLLIRTESALYRVRHADETPATSPLAE